MSTQLEIQPRELRFAVELNKQSKCTIRLLNKTDQHVAFKVKTTSPKKYCVRPNVGVIKPKSSHEFVVIMQALKVPVEMTSKDKFLIQNTIVPEGTVEEDVTSETFSKEGGKHIEESKLRVFFVTAPFSSESSANSTQKQVDEHTESKSSKSEDVKPVKSTEVEPIQELKKDSVKNVKFDPTVSVHSTVMKGGEFEVTKDMDSILKRIDGVRKPMDEDEVKIFKDIEEMKSKFHQLELKLNKAEVTISKLTEERKVAIKDKESLQQEMAFLQRKKIERKVQDGFPLLFVCMVALVSLIVGYNFHP